MFKKNDKRATVKMIYEEEGYGYSSTSVPLKDGELLDYLQNELTNFGELTITRISDNEIHLTTSSTLEYQETENKVNEISDLIHNYIKSRALEMDAYAVFAKSELKGVFGQKYNAGFKRNNLVRQGFKEEEIEIKPIKIESFEDIS